MQTHSLWALVLNLGIASAFQDASPFFLFSTSRLANTSLDTLNIASSSQVTSSVLKALESCASQTYLFVEQPAARLADFGNSKAAPALRSQVLKEDKNILSSYTVQEVAGKIGTEEITKFLSTQCQARRLNPAVFNGMQDTERFTSPSIVSIKAVPLPSTPKERAFQLRNNDETLSSLLETASVQGGYTVIYTTTPPSLDGPYPGAHSQQIYEMDDLDFANSEHIELKRDFNGHIRAAENSSLPLFETYQFLSPGLFMGGFVSLVLILILYVGVSAIAGLEVSYMAFSKEMGPAAQKKQQ